MLRLILTLTLVLSGFCFTMAVGNTTSHNISLTSPINDFSVSLFTRLSKESGQKNVFASPFSVSTALSMLALGARNRSVDQIQSTLGLNGVNSEAASELFADLLQSFTNTSGVSIANYALLQKSSPNNSVLNDYKAVVDKYYGAKVDDVDFSTNGEQIKDTINQWANDNTKGLIQKLLDEAPDPDTQLALLNAIHFQRQWKHPFSQRNTRNDTFYNKGTEETQTEFMIEYSEGYFSTRVNISGQEAQVVDLPYLDSVTGYETKGSMVIILPNERNGLASMMQSDDFELSLKSAVQSALNIKEQDYMNVYIPKFKFETSYDLKPALKSLGITDIFDANAANLSGVAGSNLFVNKAMHKAMIDVDEKGTKAAAVTGMFAVPASAFVGTITDFKADHPFIFLIKEESGLILFMGKVEEF